MVASAVFITDVQGKHIISRNYRGDVPITKAVEVFAKYLTDIPDEQKKPIFYHDGEEFMMEDENYNNDHDYHHQQSPAMDWFGCVCA